MQGIQEYILTELDHHINEIKTGIYKQFKELLLPENTPFINLFSVLYFHEMKYELDNPQWNRQDQLLVSHLPSLPYLLATLARAGFLPWNQCQKQQLWLETELKSHSLLLQLPGINGVTSRPLLGAHYANGLALTGKYSRLPFRVYYLFPPEANPQLFEPAFSAAGKNLDNLTYIAPDLDRETRILLIHRFFALGWHIQEVDFSDLKSILAGFTQGESFRNKPTIILG